MNDSGAEFLKWLGQALVVGIGWVVVHRLSSVREQDKARRDLIVNSADDLIQGIDGILALAHEYHVNARSSSQELVIKLKLQDLAMRALTLTDLCRESAALGACRSDIAGLRRAVTGQHFEDEHEAPLHEAAEQLQLIADSALRTKRSLMRLRHSQYQPQA